MLGETHYSNEFGYRVTSRRTDSVANRFDTKWERAKYIEQLLLSGKHFRRADMARKMGLSRSTIGRLIDDLSRFLPIAEDENGKIYLC